jgi:hypothetical protein
MRSPIPSRPGSRSYTTPSDHGRAAMKAMYDLQKQRGADVKDMSAVDAVKSYQAVIEAHETGMSKFVPAFQSLYDSRSDSQKHIADAMFRGKVRAASAKKAAKRAG